MTKAAGKEEFRRNPLAVGVSSLLQFIRDHKSWVLGSLVAVLAIAVAAGAYGWYKDRQERAAQAVLVKAQTALLGDGSAAAPRKPEDAKKLYTEIAATYPRTVAAEESLVRLGNLQFDGGKYEEAAATFDRYLTTYPRGRFLVIAGVGKAYAEEAKGDLAGAEKTLVALVESAKDDPLAGEAYSSLAHVYEVMKKPEEAARIYGQIADRFSQTHWSQNALQRMSALKTK
jgi:outer membrane protein assembly factor BamD (BamD/ComL family)